MDATAVNSPPMPRRGKRWSVSLVILVAFAPPIGAQLARAQGVVHRVTESSVTVRRDAPGLTCRETLLRAGVAGAVVGALGKVLIPRMLPLARPTGNSTSQDALIGAAVGAAFLLSVNALVKPCGPIG